MLKTSISTLLLLVGVFCQLSAQEIWTLERCIQYAEQNNIQLKQADYNIQDAEYLLQQSRNNRLPNLNSNFNGGLNFGRTINPVTNDFEDVTFLQNSVGLNSNIPIYTGGRLKTQIEQSINDVKVANANAESTFNDLALQIATAYLNILQTQELLDNARRQLELSQRQLEQTERLIQAGSLAINDKYDFIAQIARDEQNIVNISNNLEFNYLNLKQLLELDPTKEILVRAPELALDDSAEQLALSFEQLYASSLNTQPQIKAGELQLESAAFNEEIAKADLRPNISLQGGVNSFFSRSLTDVPFEQDSYFKQINNNFGQSLGAGIFIPIYNRGNTKVNIERAKLGVLQQRVRNEQVKQQLKADVQNAIAGARNAKATLEAGQKTLEAAQAAFQNAENRFTLGAINSFDLTAARNQLDQALTNVTSAKYDYLFRLKIIDFYLGKTMSLD